MVRFRSPAPYGEVPEWPKGADCKSVVSDFGGSNPPLSTSKKAHRKMCFFVYVSGGFRLFSSKKTANTLCVSNHLSVLTLGLFAQVQPCAIKRIHPSPPRKSVSFGTDFPFAKSFAFRQNFLGTTTSKERRKRVAFAEIVRSGHSKQT